MLTLGRSRSVCTPGRAPGLHQHDPQSKSHKDALWEFQTPGSADPRPSYRPVAAEGGGKDEKRQRGQQARSIREGFPSVVKKKNCVSDSKSILNLITEHKLC